MIKNGLAQRMRQDYDREKERFEDMAEEKRSNCGDYHFKVPKIKGMMSSYRRRNRTSMFKDIAPKQIIQKV